MFQSKINGSCPPEKAQAFISTKLDKIKIKSNQWCLSRYALCIFCRCTYFTIVHIFSIKYISYLITWLTVSNQIVKGLSLCYKKTYSFDMVQAIDLFLFLKYDRNH